MPVRKRTSRKSSKEPRFTPALLEKLKKATGFPINLDMRFGEHVISGHAIGGSKPEEDEVTVLVHGLVRNVGYPLAAARFTPAKWAEFKKMGDMFFDSLKKARRRNAKGKKKTKKR